MLRLLYGRMESLEQEESSDAQEAADLNTLMAALLAMAQVLVSFSSLAAINFRLTERPISLIFRFTQSLRCLFAIYFSIRFFVVTALQHVRYRCPRCHNLYFIVQYRMQSRTT